MRPPSPSPPHHLSTINHRLSDSRPQINLAKNPPSCSYNPMQSGDTILHRLHSWNFRPDIGLPNIRSKLPENPFNIKIAGQTDLLIKVDAATTHPNKRLILADARRIRA